MISVFYHKLFNFNSMKKAEIKSPPLVIMCPIVLCLVRLLAPLVFEMF